MSIKLLGISGSTRTASLNRRLLRACLHRAESEGAETTLIDLKALDIPLYDGDLEDTNGVPENARKLKRLFLAQDGIFLSCPEYNAGISPLLKNTLDWISRVKEPGDPYKTKVFALGAASTGAFGGMRGLIGMRTILEVGLGAMVLPQMVAVSNAAGAFDEKGELSDERAGGQLDKLVDALLRATRIEMSH